MGSSFRRKSIPILLVYVNEISLLAKNREIELVSLFYKLQHRSISPVSIDTSQLFLVTFIEFHFNAKQLFSFEALDGIKWLRMRKENFFSFAVSSFYRTLNDNRKQLKQTFLLLTTLLPLQTFTNRIPTFFREKNENLLKPIKTRKVFWKQI